MVSSLSFSPPYLLGSQLQCNYPLVSRWNPSPRSRIKNSTKFRQLICSSGINREFSWSPIEGNPDDDFGGWFILEPEVEDRKGMSKLVLAGVGTSIAILVGVFGYYSFSKKGFNITSVAPFHSLCEGLRLSKSREVPVEVTESTVIEDTWASGTLVADKPDMGADEVKPNVDHLSDLSQKKRVIVPVAADAVQQEALCVLKRLKIIENDASAVELCTRREYARWLVKANSMLERNPKHRIVPMIMIAGSMITAFDDVSASDPDFWSIQALGESGIIPSKLSDRQGRYDFSPESFVSRFDLVNWKAMLEYPFTSDAKEKMLTAKVGLSDLSSISLDLSPQLLMDLMAGDRSITRRVFGNIRRLQPHIPVTKAQAAVALTSGRMGEAISAELARLELENQSKFAEIEEIRSEIIRRGEIQRIWEEKLELERERGSEVERDLQIALFELEEEKTAREESLVDHMKQKAALDYRQLMLHGLREEVDAMYHELANERANVLAEQHYLEKLSAEVRAQQEAIIEAKSILEAEKEALWMLRYWVEEEARKAQARGNFLKQAAHRWKWDPSTTGQGQP